jgi:DNA-binding response OmpR family regulator
VVKILLIEDDKLLTKVYNKILEAAGYNVNAIEDGGLGYLEILRGGYDLILLDITLPNKNGMQILHDLQKIKPTEENGPIVILSNVDDENMIKKALKLGAAGFLLKHQFEPRFLAKEVENYLSQKKLY